MPADEKKHPDFDATERTLADSPADTSTEADDATLIEESIESAKEDQTLVSDAESARDTDRTVMLAPSLDAAAAEDAGATVILPSQSGTLDEAAAIEATLATHAMADSSANAGDDATMIEASGDMQTVDRTVLDDGSGTSDSFDQTLVEGGTSPTASGTATEYVPAQGQPKREFPSLGRFEILKLLGQGAFGAVYLAHDPHLDRQVAIKVAKTGVLVGKQDVDRFMREARSAAQLRHPNIVPVYEVGQLPNTNFIAYEFIEGRTLGDLMKERKKLTQTEAAVYMKKIAAGLDYAHQHGIVHRDMKPDNVLLDVNNEPHIADFGLARRDEGDTTRTREGMFMGTPSYMSPEQASGKAHLADARSDVWSLGVMLQEMLTGVRPFQGTVTEVLVAVQNYEPPSLRTIDKAIPEDLETIVEKCLTKNADERYQSAQLLADELERWLRGEPILARPISVFGRTWRWMKRNPQVASLIGAVIVSVLIGSVGMAGFGWSAMQSERRARQAALSRAESQLTAIRTAEAASLPVLIESLDPYREELRSQLMGLVGDSALTREEQSRVRLAATTLYADAADHDALVQQAATDLLQLPPVELLVRSQMLTPYRAQVEGPLWNAARDIVLPQRTRFQAMAALATLGSSLPDWSATAPDLTAQMLTMNPLELSNWMPAMRPIRHELEAPLTRAFTEGADGNAQYRAAIVLGELFRDTPETLLALVPQAAPRQLGPLVDALRPRADYFSERLSERLSQVLATSGGQPFTDAQAADGVNLSLALLGLGRSEAVWPLLAESPNQHLRTALIHEVAPARISWEAIAGRMEWEPDPTVLAALGLVLGEYGEGELLPSDRGQLIPVLLKLFREHPHAGVHSSVEWVLRRWGQGPAVDAAIGELASRDRDPGRRWHIDGQQKTFVVIEPDTFEMGAAPDELPGNESEKQHRRLIPRTYGIATREVTLAEYLEFDPDFDLKRVRRFAPGDDCPVVNIKWYDAAAFCRWLSEKEGFEEHEMCYPSLDEFAALRQPSLQRKSIDLPGDLLDRPGYRLPTAAEWEYAARSGTLTRRPFGNSDQYLGQYVWYQLNADGHTWPAGSLKPNSYGLFDIQGNALEWCHNYWYETLPPAGPEGVIIDGPETRDSVTRECRGGSYRYSAETLRVAYTDYIGPGSIFQDLGFRIARTYQTTPPP